MPDAVRGGALRAVYQPIVDLKTGRIAAREGLSRVDRDLGFAHAGELFDAAVEAGVGPEVDAIAHGAVFDGAAGMAGSALLFVNCLPEVVAREGFADAMLGRVRASGVFVPSRVVLEITERSEIGRLPGLVEEVERLKSAGFQIAIDDVGAGASGLNRIMQLRPAWLKLDRELVDRIDLDHVKQNLVRFMLHFAKLSGVRMVAEGIEREEELVTLARLGVPYGQGYLLARPGGVDDGLGDDARRALEAAGQAAAGVAEGDERVTASDLARETVCVDADEAASALRVLAPQTDGCGGFLAVRGGMVVGWIPGGEATRAHGDGVVVGDLADDGCTVVEPGAELSDLLGLAAAQAGAGVHHPLIVHDPAGRSGVIDAATLLSAAATHARQLEGRVRLMTDLPGEVACDRHVARLCRSVDVPGVSGLAIAFVDLVGFKDFNDFAGYELGDQIIRDLASTAAACVRDAGVEESDAFIGHRGQDRFLITAPGDRIDEIVRTLVDRFGVSGVPGLLPDGSAGDRGSAPVGPGGFAVPLRVLVHRRAFAEGRSQRAVLRLEGVLRRLADERAAASGEGRVRRAIVVFGGDEGEAGGPGGDGLGEPAAA